MTNEQIELLRKWEHHFTTAVKCGYVRGVEREALVDMKKVTDELTHPHSDAILKETCPVCIFNFVKQIGKWYFENTSQE